LQSVTFDTFVMWTCAVCCFCFIVFIFYCCRIYGE